MQNIIILTLHVRTNCFKYCLHFWPDEHILEFKTFHINAFEVSNGKTPITT